MLNLLYQCFIPPIYLTMTKILDMKSSVQEYESNLKLCIGAVEYLTVKLIWQPPIT